MPDTHAYSRERDDETPTTDRFWVVLESLDSASIALGPFEWLHLSRTVLWTLDEPLLTWMTDPGGDGHWELSHLFVVHPEIRKALWTDIIITPLQPEIGIRHVALRHKPQLRIVEHRRIGER